MPSSVYQTIQQNLVSTLAQVINSQTSSLVQNGETPVSTLVKNLVDALPYFQDISWQTSHHGVLSQIMQCNMPNAPIQPQASESGLFWRADFSYEGQYSGYQDAFFHGVTATAATSATLSQIQNVSSALNNSWWGNYAVAVLADAIRQTLNLALDTGKLSASLESNNQSFLPALSASFLGVFTTTYTPTVNALNAINAAGVAQAATDTLTHSIVSSQFIANINEVLATGGESAQAAVWLLFNLWITLKALNLTNVDGFIQQAQTAGLNVPLEIAPQNWWNGKYISWYLPLSGSDMLTTAITAVINAGLPESEISYSGSFSGQGSSSVNPVTYATGYSLSFCYLGSLNYFLPPDTSCFGANTNVLMANGIQTPICQLKTGDLVHTDQGPCPVMLVESPKRKNRNLFQINNCQVFATSAHPFRAAEGAFVKRFAIDPWALADGIPTMISQGIGELKPESQLSGWMNNAPCNLPVVNINILEIGQNNEERVYDLILDGWARKKCAYYVGGPTAFFAVEAETLDPLYYKPGTFFIITVMQLVLDTCRKYLPEPDRQIPDLLTQIDIKKALIDTRIALATINQEIEFPAVPPSSFYMQKESWDPYASLLEFHLGRQWGKMMRRETTSGWYKNLTDSATVRHIVIDLHDIELIGGHELPADIQAGITVRLLRSDNVGDLTQTMEFTTGAHRAWNIVLDQHLNFGPEVQPGSNLSLIGFIYVQGKNFGHFRTALLGDGLHDTMLTPFIFNMQHQVIGRTALRYRTIHADHLDSEQRLAKTWNRNDQCNFAVALGRQVGEMIISHCKSRYSAEK